MTALQAANSCLVAVNAAGAKAQLAAAVAGGGAFTGTVGLFVAAFVVGRGQARMFYSGVAFSGGNAFDGVSTYNGASTYGVNGTSVSTTTFGGCENLVPSSLPMLQSVTQVSDPQGTADGPWKMVLTPAAVDTVNASSVMTYYLDQNALVVLAATING
jgi:hypothetical protein